MLKIWWWPSSTTALSRPEFLTYFGGKGHEFDASLTIDHAGTIHVAATSVGWNRNEDGPFIPTVDFPVKNAYQSEFGGRSQRFCPFNRCGRFRYRPTRCAYRPWISRDRGPEFNHVVAEFTSPRPASVGDFTVSINWGDGETSSGFVTHPNSSNKQYFVHGTHQYVKAGAYPVTVTVTDSVADNLSPIRAVNVSQSVKSQIGGVIAVDPTDPTRLFAAMSDFQVERGIRVATELMIRRDMVAPNHWRS